LSLEGSKTSSRSTLSFATQLAQSCSDYLFKNREQDNTSS
jgi:hypothetical protein